MPQTYTCPHCKHFSPMLEASRFAQEDARTTCPQCGSPFDTLPITGVADQTDGTMWPAPPPAASIDNAHNETLDGKSIGALPLIPGYAMICEIGRGGMGVVYRARCLRLNRIVALKMILAGPFTSSDQLVRFRTETEAVAQLQHANIVQIYEVGEFEGRPYCAFEYVDGGSLASKIFRTPQPSRYSAEMIENLARAIHSAHLRGIVHRDLKPDNILLTTEGAPKICDFGLAKRVEAQTGQTQTGSILGTPGYMAPEQAAGNTRQVGPAADVWALGAILYHLLTGQPPFHGAALLETLEQVRTRDPVPPSRLRPKLSRDLEVICLKCLEKTRTGATQAP